MTISFSVFTKPWPYDPFADLAGRVARMGFDSVEIPIRPGFQVDVTTVSTKLGELSKVLGGRGLRISSVASELDERVFEACAAAGVNIIRVMVPIERGAYVRSIGRQRSKLATALPLCERYSVRVGVQQHYGDHVNDAAGMRLLLGGLDPRWVGAIWDAAHDALAGQEPENGLDLVWDRLLMVNLKNACYERANGPDAEHAEWRRHFTTARQGLASWPRVIAELRRRGYSGTVCLTAEYDDQAHVQELCEGDLAYAKSLVDRQ